MSEDRAMKIDFAGDISEPAIVEMTEDEYESWAILTGVVAEHLLDSVDEIIEDLEEKNE